jgi:hypothetical protein
MMPAPMTAEKFWSKVDRSGGEGACWPWLGSFFENGYGQVSWNYKKLRAHRVAYTLTNGPISDGLLLDHIECKNRACCNPDHVRPVTPQINSIENSDGQSALNAAKTHCPQGHAYAGDNLIFGKGRRGRPERRCRTCHREKNAKWRANASSETKQGIEP